MWAAIIALASKLLGIFFPDKSAETQGREAGEVAGKAEQKAADQSAVISQQDKVIHVQDEMASVPATTDAVDRLRSGSI